MSITMDADQFQTLVHGVAQHDVQRRAIQSQRDIINSLVTQTTKCDGSSTPTVRLWVKEIELAYNQVGQPHIIEIVTRCVSHNFRFETERFINQYVIDHHVNRDAVPWAHIRAHLSEQFLNTDEMQSLRDEVERTTQSMYDTIPQFSRKFREISEAAFPRNQRNGDQERLLDKSFAKVLNSDDIARRLVESLAPPATLEEAIALVARLNERQDAYHRLGRQEEPMEVGALGLGPPADKSHFKTLSDLSLAVERLNTKIAKMELLGVNKNSSNNKESSNDGAKGKGNKSNRRNRKYDKSQLCFACNQPGHWAKDCRHRVGYGNNQQGSSPMYGNNQPGPPPLLGPGPSGNGHPW